MPTFPTQRLPVFFARLTAVLLAFGACQLVAAGAADRARNGHLGRSAGNRLSASRSEALGCEVALRDGSHPGDTFVSSGDDVPSAPCFYALALAVDVVSPLPLPPESPGALATLPIVSAPPAPLVPALSGRGPPRC